MNFPGTYKIWSFLFARLQVLEEDAQDVSEVASDADSETDVPEAIDPPKVDQELPTEEPVEVIERTQDPIEAITETTEKATEAATEFVGWVGSGELEALIALALVIGFTAFQIASRWLIMRSVKRVPRDDDYSLIAIAQRVVKRFHIYFMFAIALALTDSILSLPGSVSGFISIYFVLALVIQIAEWVQEFAVSAIKRSVHRGGGDAKALASAFNIIKYFITLIVWTIALLLIMSNVGMDVTALLAGLGIGGIAIGIASQGIFRDLFSSLSIIIDKPFQVGDTVRYDGSWGNIEEIGLKTTRIRARSGEQLIISNTKLLDFEIHNMTRMARRRIETEFGVIYQTDPDLADRIPGIVAEMFRGIQGVEFDRCGMSSFGPSSLDYTLVFYSLNPDYNRSMAARSKVLLALFRTFKENDVEFAYPTQTLYVEELKED
ncbi:MAG: mechanosensitive ion channel domain-containing protein [Pseudomonadota bacterium]